MKNIFLLIFLTIVFINCQQNKKTSDKVSTEIIPTPKTSSIDLDTIRYTNGFDFPVGKPDAKGYYNAQKFTENNHLGEDWNGKNGGNSDLGDPIFSTANGYVTFAENIAGGWGNVIRIVHYINKYKQVESLYAHCNRISVKKGDYILKGQKIGTIGNNDGQYLAHLHFELRHEIGLPIGGGYAVDTSGYLNPTAFIKMNR